MILPRLCRTTREFWDYGGETLISKNSIIILFKIEKEDNTYTHYYYNYNNALYKSIFHNKEGFFGDCIKEIPIKNIKLLKLICI